MIDVIEYPPELQKQIVILFRAKFEYPSHTFESTVTYLHPRVDHVNTRGHEWEEAEYWWRRLSANEQEKLQRAYLMEIDKIS